METLQLWVLVGTDRDTFHAVTQAHRPFAVGGAASAWVERLSPARDGNGRQDSLGEEVWKARELFCVLAEIPWADHDGDPKFWRGAMLSKFREELYNLVQGYEWNDIDHLDWGTLNNRVEMEDHCKHRYLASIEGNSACTGFQLHPCELSH